VNIIAGIHVKPWLFKFLAREYGNPYIMDKRDSFSTLLFSNLGNKKLITPAVDIKNGNTQVFKIRLASRYYLHRGLVDIPEINKQALRNHFENIFYSRLTEYVYAKQEIKNQYPENKELHNQITIRSSIQQFLNRYNIADTDYEITSIERRYRMFLDKKLLTIAGATKIQKIA
jgi:hypothetical protein